MNRNLIKRLEYRLGALKRKDLKPTPMKQFENWYREAVRNKIYTPNAAVLSTTSKKGLPSGRVILIKEFDVRGFRFYTSYVSPKAEQISSNPRAELVFYWAELERQVRISGKIKKLSRNDSARYFATRPRGAQLAASVSAQSKPIESRERLTDRVAELDSHYKGKQIPLPADWGGFMLVPESYEFWQGRQDRLNDRFRYVKKSGKTRWKIDRLQP